MPKEIEIPTLYKRKEECCGCAACYAICPESAIVMEEDEEGFEYPKVKYEKCRRCYLCLKICQFKKEQQMKSLKELEQKTSKKIIDCKKN